jgi:hypothetical protein
MAEEWTDETGTRYSGEVLSRSERAARRREVETLEVLSRTMMGEFLGRGFVAGAGDGAEDPERYEEVGDYDAVLRWHCRL